MLTNDDVVQGRKRKTSIARSAWPIELHSGEKPRLEWLLDDYYDIAYENFVPIKGEGLLIAGRCLSAEHEAMASARVTAQCFSYGQAIGMGRCHVRPRWDVATKLERIRSARSAPQGWCGDLMSPSWGPW